MRINEPHAYVEGGQLFLMESGRYWPTEPGSAWSEWAYCATSPIPSTQERARQIKAALIETGFYQ